MRRLSARTQARNRSDAIQLRRGQQFAEQHRAEPAILPAVLHDEGDLGHSRLAGRLVARHGDERIGIFRRLDDERQPRLVVDVGVEARPVGRQPLHDREETAIARVATQVIVERHEARRVVRTDRTHADAGAVTQEDRPVESLQALGRVTHSIGDTTFPTGRPGDSHPMDGSRAVLSLVRRR